MEQKYEYDKALSFVFTTNKSLNYPQWLVPYFETDEDAKAFALNYIQSEGYKDYKVLEERLLNDAPHLMYGTKLYEIRIVK